jgi:hypothetical protein
MVKKQEIEWSGSDDNGYVGAVAGLQLYQIHTELYPPRAPFQKKAEYLFLARRLNPRGFEGVGDTSHTAGEAMAQCEADFRNGGRAAFHKAIGYALIVVEAAGFTVSKSKAPEHRGRVLKPILDDALAVVKAAGYRVNKPKIPKPKGRPGPVFACEFSDGTRVRMSVACSTETLDWVRGERLAKHAWASRHKVPLDCDSAELAKIAPPISVCRFERDGTVLAERRNGGGAA